MKTLGTLGIKDITTQAQEHLVKPLSVNKVYLQMVAFHFIQVLNSIPTFSGNWLLLVIGYPPLMKWPLTLSINKI